jgi:UDPglucose 6-dehydrogenase
MRVGVLGIGHMGLVTSATLAHLGHDIIGADTDPRKSEALSSGRAPFFEPGLQELLDEEIDAGRLRFTDDPSLAVADADVIFLCVGTPPDANGNADLSAVHTATTQIAGAATGPLVVVGKSTVPAGTMSGVAASLHDLRPDVPFEVVSNPEFLREGSAVHDSLEPDRILVGTQNEAALDVMRKLYTPQTSAGAQLIETDVTSAELAKHACNAFLALKISYANALALMCEQAGADVLSVTAVMGADPRIGSSFLVPGLGYGGHCLPKDVTAFRALAKELGHGEGLLDEVVKLNASAIDAVVDHLERALGSLRGRTIAVFGLSFKPQTDDVRNSPSLSLAKRLIDAGAEVRAHDPQVTPDKVGLTSVVLYESAAVAATDADGVVVATAWHEYRDLDWRSIRGAMSGIVVLDARNALDPSDVTDAGLDYHAVGRPIHPHATTDAAGTAVTPALDT